jgi:hypothetical protein
LAHLQKIVSEETKQQQTTKAAVTPWRLTLRCKAFRYAAVGNKPFRYATMGSHAANHAANNHANSNHHQTFVRDLEIR